LHLNIFNPLASYSADIPRHITLEDYNVNILKYSNDYILTYKFPQGSSWKIRLRVILVYEKTFLVFMILHSFKRRLSLYFKHSSW